MYTVNLPKYIHSYMKKPPIIISCRAVLLHPLPFLQCRLCFYLALFHTIYYICIFHVRCNFNIFFHRALLYAMVGFVYILAFANVSAVAFFGNVLLRRLGQDGKNYVKIGLRQAKVASIPDPSPNSQCPACPNRYRVRFDTRRWTIQIYL